MKIRIEMKGLLWPYGQDNRLRIETYYSGVQSSAMIGIFDPVLEKKLFLPPQSG